MENQKVLKLCDDLQIIHTQQKSSYVLCFESFETLMWLFDFFYIFDIFALMIGSSVTVTELFQQFYKTIRVRW